MCTVPDCHRSAIADHQYENSTWTNVQLKWFFLGCVFFLHILSSIHFGVYFQFWERHNTHSMTVHYLTGTSKNPFCPCLYIYIVLSSSCSRITSPNYLNHLFFDPHMPQTQLWGASPNLHLTPVSFSFRTLLVSCMHILLLVYYIYVYSVQREVI